MSTYTLIPLLHGPIRIPLQSTDIKMHTICLTCTVTMVTKQLMPVLLADSACSTYTAETLSGIKAILYMQVLCAGKTIVV